MLRARTRGRLRSARDVHVAAGARVQVARGARVILGPGATLARESRIDALGGTVRLGPGARLGERAVLVAQVGVEIGARAVIGDWAVVADVAPTWADVETPVRAQPLRRAAIVVGERAVLGPHAVLGPGASVAADANVAPYAVLPAPRGAAVSAS